MPHAREAKFRHGALPQTAHQSCQPPTHTRTHTHARTRLPAREARSSGALGAELACALSPYLALGCVSARRVAFEAAYDAAVVFEVLWRDYFALVSRKYARAAAAVIPDIRYFFMTLSSAEVMLPAPATDRR